MRSALTSSSGARRGSNCPSHCGNSPQQQRSETAEERPRICTALESGRGPRERRSWGWAPFSLPSRALSLLAQATPRPLPVLHAEGEAAARQAAGTRQHGTAPPPRQLRAPRPPSPGRAEPRPGPAARPTSPLRARPRLPWPAGLGAALPGSTRRAPTHPPGSARPGPAPQPPSLPGPPRPFYKCSCFEIYNYVLQRIQGYVWNRL